MPKPTPDQIWQDLNPRQQLYLSSIFDADQAREAQRAADSAAGHWDDTPAAVWRLIDAYHEPSLPALVSYTALQTQWRHAGVHDQGTGSTMAVLHERALITFGHRPTRYGVMRQVAMTTLGRKVVRASRGWKAPARAKKPPAGLLRERAVEVLLILAQACAGQRGYLDWGHSRTIEDKLIHHDPPLAASYRPYGGGYVITEAGTAHLADHHAAYVELYPQLFPADVPAPEPVWPAEADRLLAALGRRCDDLVFAEEDLRALLAEAATATVARPPMPGGRLVDLRTELHRLDMEHARVRVGLIRGRLEQLDPLGPAVAAYVTAALAALAAAADGTDPVAAIQATVDGADLEALPTPAVVGATEVDVEAARLYRLATGKRTRGRRPAKAALGISRHRVPAPAADSVYAIAWALAAHLESAVAGGRAYDLAHPAPKPATAPRRPSRPRHLLDEIAHRLLAALAAADTPERAASLRQHVAQSGRLAPKVVADLPGGLLSGSVTAVTRSTKAIEKLTSRGLAAVIDLRSLPGCAPYRNPYADPAEADRPWPLLHLTDAGRTHHADHHQAYAELYPDHSPQPAGPASLPRVNPVRQVAPKG
ncbi:hypothetical protein [Kitasatospora sp. NPDC090091]|uniref:hypothetical protein n=1 Tax=Kitasatospora sp. NPDC090091 TaxID=3364081 RepID=UPI003813871C